ncbi:MAG: fibronectin type III domain-containing protein [Flavobacteriales bacterium]|nr:fibronectin type III domain-containing protein [Flavobacteriales bacterium]
MQTVVQVKLGLDGLTPTALVEKGRNLVEACTNNANVTLPADFLTNMAKAVDELEAANLRVLKNGGREDHLVRKERARDVAEWVRQLGGYVEAQCVGDAEKIASCGFQTRKRPSPVGLVDAPKNVRALRGKLPGTADLRWDRVKGRLLYDLYICDGDPLVEANWRLLLQTSKNYHTATDLTPDAVYYFRTRAIGTAGAGPLSETVNAKAA